MDVAVGFVVTGGGRGVVFVAVARVPVGRLAGVPGAFGPLVSCPGRVTGGVVQVVNVLQRARPEEGERNREQDGPDSAQGS